MAVLMNVWHLRKVAEASAKACDICHKPTASVLITPDNKDYFYVCSGHLKDRNLATPIIDEAEAAVKKKQEAMDREIELIKQEYEEKMKKKKKKKQNSTSKKVEDVEKGKEKAKKDEGKSDDDDEEKAKKEKDDKIKAATDKGPSSVVDDIPRIYALQKTFYQKRIDRKRNAELAKRNLERMKNPTLFPSVPTGNLG